MNSSVPGLVSPPLIDAAATRMPTTTATIAQNSVVLNACFVSVERRRIALVRADRSTPAPALPARVVADSMVIPPRWMRVTKLGQAPRGRDGTTLGADSDSDLYPRYCDPGDPFGATSDYPRASAGKPIGARGHPGRWPG